MSDPRRQRRLWYVLGAVAIAGFVAFGATSFRQNITPYVDFETAQRSGTRVQVAGELVDGTARYNEATQQLEFTMVDEDGRSMRVVYNGVKPGNFEEATEIVAVGSYTGGVFHAEQLLVKCPSKYQGVETADSAG